jgi:hypothetical protein
VSHTVSSYLDTLLILVLVSFCLFANFPPLRRTFHYPARSTSSWSDLTRTLPACRSSLTKWRYFYLLSFFF